MTDAPRRRCRFPPWMARYVPWRFVKFGLVGASGAVVNLAVVYAGQEWLFRTVEPDRLRLNVSLALAIFFATINNFTWNRAWTWGDRRALIGRALLLQFGQYALACWIGIALQFVLSNLLVAHFHYLIANAIAIVVASLFNFVSNDLWTFDRIRLWLQRRI
ncbi:MAG: GtrA family protein [Burkholderiales bacterium]|nr:GtrA family protein [Burkholderiales bacterium]